jgi:hypothetical protein
VFIVPDRGGNQFTIGNMRLAGDEEKKPVSAISTSTFCNAFLEAANEFIMKTKDDPIVQKIFWVWCAFDRRDTNVTSLGWR